MSDRERRHGHTVVTLAAAVLGMMVGAGPGRSASAETLLEAMGRAYVGNPTLDAQRAQLRATNEQVPQALAGRRPTVRVTGQAGPQWTDTTQTSTWARTNPRNVGLEMVQPLYRGGQIEAGVARAEAAVLAQRATLAVTEQKVLLDAATAYLNVLRDTAVLGLNVNNEKVLGKQLEATRDRFRVGEITRTDVSQAESRAARAGAERVSAEGVLSSSRATYIRVIGVAPDRLQHPKLKPRLPESRAAAVAAALAGNPSVQAALHGETAARYAVEQSEGALLPSLDLKGSVSRAEDPTYQLRRSENATILAQVTVPLYQGGGEWSRLREAKESASRRRIEIEEARRAAEEAANQAWDGLVTARASIHARQAQEQAAQIALDGVRQEMAVGSRTVLDTLDAEQELLDARVNLARSRRDEAVAAFTLLAAVGQLTAPTLGLEVPVHDNEKHYRAVRDQWIGGTAAE